MRNKNRAQTAKPHTRKKPHTQAHAYIAATERPRGEHIKMNKKLADDDGFWLLFQKHTCINLPIPTDEVSERLSADLLLQTVVNNTFYRSFGAATRILLLLQYIIYWFTLSSLFSRGPLVRVSFALPPPPMTYYYYDRPVRFTTAVLFVQSTGTYISLIRKIGDDS